MSLDLLGRLALLALAATLAVRGVAGAAAAWSYRAGRTAAIEGRYPEAAERLPRGAFGAHGLEAKWLEGEVALGAWDLSRSPQRLERATACFLDGLRRAPSSGWPMSGLAGVYLRRERAARGAREIDLALLERPWEMLGDDGRVGLGFLREAIAREPGNLQFRDALVLAFEANGLHDEALAAMREAARVVPDFGAHEAFTFETLPRDLVEAFYEESRSRIGEAPLQLVERQLLSLGQLGRRLGRLPEAEADLRRALASRGSEIYHAEDAYHLALVLLDQGRGAEADALLARAGAFEVFAPEVAAQRARIAEQDGRLADALEHLRTARALRPRTIHYALRFAQVAARMKAWDQAREALRWAALTHPGDPEPQRSLVEVAIAEGNAPAASAELEAYVRKAGKTAEAERLAGEVARLLDSPLR